MITYEFYMRDEANVYQLIGILPERRKSPERITPESIINWAKGQLGDDLDLDDILYIPTTVDENTEEIGLSPSVSQAPKPDVPLDC
ncbi:MAG: hypothetical protein WCO26_21175 [Deltaproteobacteria bacterium]